MTTDATAPWEQLFPPPTNAERSVTLSFRLVRRHAEPLLLLRAGRRGIVAALSLYPAQTPKAKLARTLLGVCLRAGFNVGTTPVSLRLNTKAAFVQWLFPNAKDYHFAVLLGNPRAPGRRFVLLLFDQNGQPNKLVKAGAGEAATALIKAEGAFLKAIPASALGSPGVLGQFSGDGISALALEFVAGTNPDPAVASPAELLTSWIRPENRVKLADLPAWQRLKAVSGKDELFRRLNGMLASTELHPAIYHGDFAPWNIRIDPTTSRWVVLDWERGEAVGPPMWDWFHFVVQSEVLVKKAAPNTIAGRVETLLASPEFRDYAAKAGVEKYGREWLLAYLLYCRAVLRQTEGLDQVERLIERLANRWLSPRQG